MASFAAFIDIAMGALKLCNKCYKCCAKEDKDKEDEENVSEDGSDTEENTKTKSKSHAAKTKTRKKRSAEYIPVNQREPTASTTTTQPQAQPTATQTLSTVISPVINIIGPSYPANMAELPGMKSTPSTSATQRCGEGIVQWIPSSIDTAMKLLQEAVVGGYDIDYSDLWIIRARVKGEIVPGKLNTEHSLAFVACRTTDTYAEKNVSIFEVCCIAPENRHRIIWIQCCNGSVPKNAILASAKDAETPLYIGRKLHVDRERNIKSLCPGMVHPDRGLWITFDFQVFLYDIYEVMCLE